MSQDTNSSDPLALPVMASQEQEAFVLYEAKLLDARRFADWLALFAENGTYWVPSVPNQKSPFNQASLFYDDMDLLKTRVGRLGHPKIHIQDPPSRTVHHVGRVTVEEPENASGECLLASTLIMAEYREDRQRIFAGRQYHRLRRSGNSFKIVHKRVDLVNCDTAFEPMAVPI